MQRSEANFTHHGYSWIVSCYIQDIHNTLPRVPMLPESAEGNIYKSPIFDRRKLFYILFFSSSFSVNPFKWSNGPYEAWLGNAKCCLNSHSHPSPQSRMYGWIWMDQFQILTARNQNHQRPPRSWSLQLDPQVMDSRGPGYCRIIQVGSWADGFVWKSSCSSMFVMSWFVDVCRSLFLHENCRCLGV